MKKSMDVPSVKGFDEIGAFAHDTVSCLNWEAFPYRPSVELYAGHTAEKLLVRFEVEEANAKAVSLEPNGPVWEDSCCEFFVRVPGDEHYFNFETNCIGTGLAAKRLSRDDFGFLTPEQMAQVVRRTSLPHEVTDLNDCAWSLELEIPFSVLGCSECPKSLEANFYKCGDKTATPHFLSWSPIDTAKPDFHRPEFFGKLILK